MCLVSSLLQLCAEGCLEDPIRLEVVAWSKRSLQYLQQLWKGVTMTTCMAKQDAAVGEQLQFAGNCVKILSSLSIIPAEFRTAVVALLPCLPQKDAIAVLVAVQHLIDGDSDPWKPRLQTIALKHVCNTAAIFPCLL